MLHLWVSKKIKILTGSLWIMLMKRVIHTIEMDGNSPHLLSLWSSLLHSSDSPVLNGIYFIIWSFCGLRESCHIMESKIGWFSGPTRPLWIQYSSTKHSSIPKHQDTLTPIPADFSACGYGIIPKVSSYFPHFRLLRCVETKLSRRKKRKILKRWDLKMIIFVLAVMRSN